MTPAQFKEARHKLGLTGTQLAKILAVSPRTVRKWEAVDKSTSRKPNPGACLIMQWMLDGWRPPEWPHKL